MNESHILQMKNVKKAELIFIPVTTTLRRNFWVNYSHIFHNLHISFYNLQSMAYTGGALLYSPYPIPSFHPKDHLLPMLIKNHWNYILLNWRSKAVSHMERKKCRPLRGYNTLFLNPVYAPYHRVSKKTTTPVSEKSIFYIILSMHFLLLLLSCQVRPRNGQREREKEHVG